MVLDDDLLEYLGYQGSGIASILGKWFEYLVTSMMTMISTRKGQLPKYATSKAYPMIYWMTIPQHTLFSNSHVRGKVNYTLEALLKLYNNIRMVKFKEIWNYENTHYLMQNGNMSTYGISKYWMAVDASIHFNILKHEQYLCKEPAFEHYELNEDQKPKSVSQSTSSKQGGKNNFAVVSHWNQ